MRAGPHSRLASSCRGTVQRALRWFRELERFRAVQDFLALGLDPLEHDCPSRVHEIIVTHSILNDHVPPNHECFQLMQKLIEYRHNKPLHQQLGKAGQHSMLSVDVLALVHYFAKTGEGNILEIGSFVGGSAIAAAMGARDSGKTKKIVSIEVGGRLDNHHLATRDIFKQLKKNLAHFGVLDAVTPINGASYDEKTIAAVRQAFGPGDVGLLIFDADDNVRRDLDCYGDRLADRCLLVIDDYFGTSTKTGPIQEQVDELIANGRLLQLGFYGWGTWIGRLQRAPIADHGDR